MNSEGKTIPRGTKHSERGGAGRGQGRPKGSLNKITLWKRAVRERSVASKPGEALAVEKMNSAMHICAELVDFYRPVFDKNGRLIEGRRKTEKFDFNRFMRALRELRKWATALAPFQSPRLSAVAVAPPPPEKTVLTVSIFDEKGERVSSGTQEERKKNLN